MYWMRRRIQETVVDAQTLLELKPQLEQFLGDFSPLIYTLPSRKHFRTYVTGLVGPGERKNAEALALAAGKPVRTLQEFLSFHKWDESALARAIRQRIVARHPEPGAVGIVDETSFAKSGDRTVGVKRQYCGESGKIDNCVVTVHLAYATQNAHFLADSDLFLPEDWADDPARRATAGVPEDLTHRTKWQIALDLIARSRPELPQLEWITGDEGYGHPSRFRDTLAAWGLKYVMEVQSDTRGWIEAPVVAPPGTRHARGPATSRPHSTSRPARVSALTPRSLGEARDFRVKDTQKGPVVWRVHDTWFHPAQENLPGPRQRLLVAINVLTREVKYFLAHAPEETSTEDLLRIAFTRWRVETVFREGKQAAGLGAFQMRSYRALQRHLVLSTLAMLFLSEQTARLRGEKSVAHAV